MPGLRRALPIHAVPKLRRLALRPEHALVAGDDVAHALVDELLDTLTLPGLGRVEVALGVGRDRVHAVELARLAAAVAEGGDLLERVAHDDAHAVVHAVGHVDEALLRIARERDVPGGARAERVLGEERFLDELAVGLEHLQAVVGAVAHVEEPVVRALDAVYGIAELLRRRIGGLIRAEVLVVGLVAVGAPVALHLAGVGVEHGDALVEIAVGDIGLVGLGIDPDFCDATEILQVVAALVAAELADLEEEFAFLGELQDVRVLLAVAADPDVAFVVDVDAVVGLRPLVALAGSAPRFGEVAVGV